MPSRGNYAEAESLLKRSLVIYEKAGSSQSDDLAASLFSLGAVYSNEGRYAEAETLLKRSLAISQKVLGANNPNLAHVLLNLSHAYKDQGKFVDAVHFSKRALAIYEKAYGPSHPDVPAALLAPAVYNDRTVSGTRQISHPSTMPLDLHFGKFFGFF